MRIKTKIIFLTLLSLGLFGWAGSSRAVTPPWSTTFNCADWTGPTNPTCDTVAQLNDTSYQCGHYSTITAAANNPLGTGKGWRIWVVGENTQTSTTRYALDGAYDEMWLRYYHRVQSGTNMNGYQDYKIFYLNYGSSSPILFELNDYGARLITNGWQSFRYDFNWSALYPGGVSDGTWNYYELYIKASTNTARFWINGTERAITQSDPAHPIGSVASEMRFRVNEHGYPSPACPYEDIDDIAISTTGYIGPLGPADITAPASSTGLSVL